MEHLPSFEDQLDENYISHHGTTGMKWGVRNGPPYPLVSRNKSAMTTANKMYSVLDTFDYGCIIDGHRYNETNLDQVDWSKYRTQPVSEFEKNKIGVCWDFTNYQHVKFKNAGIDHSTYMLVMDTDDGPVTHTFTTFNDPQSGKQYWFEQALYSERGIHQIDTYKDVAHTVAKRYDGSLSKPFDLYLFDPDGMDKGLTDTEFFNMATKDDPIFQRK